MYIILQIYHFSLQQMKVQLEKRYCDGSWERNGICNIPFLPKTVRLPDDKGIIRVRNLRIDEADMFYGHLVNYAKKEVGYVGTEFFSLKLFLDTELANSFCVVFEMKDSEELLGIYMTTRWPNPNTVCEQTALMVPEKQCLGYGRYAILLNQMLMRDVGFDHIFIDMLASNPNAYNIASMIDGKYIGRLPLSAINLLGLPIDSIFFMKNITDISPFRSMKVDGNGDYIMLQEHTR